jgi:hypothetical protein
MTKEENSIYQKQYYLKNKDKFIKYRKENKQKIYLQRKEYREKNKEKMKIQYEKAKEKRKIYRNNRRKTDYLYCLKCKIRKNINASIKKKGFTKRSNTYSILGCDYDFFKNYIESQFTKNMNWDNIHLDHIKPLATANTEKEILELNHYTNFQPLLAKENLNKAAKIIEKQLRIL